MTVPMRTIPGTTGSRARPTIRTSPRPASRDQRALLATLMLARGTPMLAMGSELGHTQGGNNNAYAQDNETAWLDWANADQGLIDWTSHLLRIRRDHAVLRDDRFLTGSPFDDGPYPDVEWRDAAGHIMTGDEWHASGRDTLVMTLAGTRQDADTMDRICVILHRGTSETQLIPPPPRGGHAWRRIADTATDVPATAASDEADDTRVAPRSVVVLTEVPSAARGRAVIDPKLLDRLSHAAGIAPEWWDVSGRRTIVSDETRRALLAAMRLPAEYRRAKHAIRCAG